MGGGQAITIGLENSDRFGYVLGFSAAVGAPFVDPEPTLQKALAARDVLNHRIKLLWLSCGREDFLYQSNRQFADRLMSGGVKVNYRETEGAHVWSVWRRNLNETVPLLFSNQR
jgi:enterochelin esterase family protein